MHRNTGDPLSKFGRMLSSVRWVKPRRIATAVLTVFLLSLLLRLRADFHRVLRESLPITVLADAGSHPVSQQVLPTAATGHAQASCNPPPGMEDVFVILRTGANEATDKLPIHFNTTLHCLPSRGYGIWSDLEEVIGGYLVHNALDEMDPHVMASNEDFAYYRRLQEAGRTSLTAEELHAWATAPNGGTGRDIPGWKLDKWKFLPMAVKAYRRRPDARWYVFMEGDTYISWNNLLQWLSLIDASKPYYLGREMMVTDDLFAYGGAGFVLSQPAMNMLVEHLAATPGVYEEMTAQHWAGDCVLGKALKNAGVELSWQGTNFFGSSPFDADYTLILRSPDRHFWCYPIATYHHVSPAEMDEIFRFEQSWNQEHSGLLRHKEFFRSLILPKIGPKVEAWENVSEDDAGSMESFDACRRFCQDKRGCLQFVFYEQTQTCKTSNAIRLGFKRNKEMKTHGKVVSGWIMDRVNVYVQEMDALCQRDHGDWLLPE